MQSKLHKVIEQLFDLAQNVVKARDPHGNIVDPPVSRELILQTALVLPLAPHYVIDREVVDLLTSGVVTDQLRALNEIGGVHLPHEGLVLEMPDIQPGVRGLFMIGELDHTNDQEGQTFAVTMVVSTDKGPTFPMAFRLEILDNYTRWSVTSSLDMPPMSHDKFWAEEAIIALETALLFPHVKGLAKETEPAPERLNKHRVAKGKPAIREFTRLYIGRVEDKDGKSHEYTGRTMPVHMRAGHTRRQHHGPGNSLIKTVYIQPVLVNFNPGDEVPVPRRIVKMAS